MKKVLVINLGWEQEPLIEKLSKREDCILYGIHYDNKPSLPKSFCEIRILDLRDIEGILSFADEINPNAVISDQCDYSLMAQALVAQKFNLPGPSIESAQLSNNKYLQRIKAKEKGILIPKFRLCVEINDIKEFTEEVGFPVIVKPIDNRGSFGVSKVNTIFEIEEAFFIAVKNSHSRMVLVEEFVHGQQITVDSYVFKNVGIVSIALATKSLSKGVQVSTRIVYPGEINKLLFNNSLKTNTNVNQSLGYSFGMIHSEYMIRANELYLIESSNRGGGVFTSEIVVPESSMIDIVEQYISDCLGYYTNLYRHPEHKEVILGFFDFRNGMVKNIVGWEEFIKNKNIIQGKLFFKVGDSLNKITTDANRHGYFIFKGNNDEANKLTKKIEVQYEK